jgi:anti-anti-sigma factor
MTERSPADAKGETPMTLPSLCQPDDLMTNNNGEASIIPGPGLPLRQPKAALAVHITEVDRAVVVSLAGEASTDNLRPLELALARVLARRVPLAVLDCSALTLLSSLAMGMLISLRRDLGRWQGCVKLACVPSRIEEVLQAARLASLFDLHATVEQALAAASDPLATAAGR